MINKKIIFSVLLIITLICNIIPTSKAAKVSGEVNVFTIGNSNNLLLYKNKSMLTIFNHYYNNEKEYPAYNALYPTYAYNNPYEEELVNENSFLWQVVVNGYPYKTIEELGCNSYEEAYIATQAAVYCAYCNHIESDYTYFEGNEASLRTYNAFLKILENARNNKISADKNTVLKLINNEVDWQIQEEYLYKTFKVKTNYEINSYNVKIANFENAQIVDENNILKSEFKSQESFKVLLPIKDLNVNGELEIQIKTEVESIPIYLGTSPYNAYILTAPRYEEQINKFSINYNENITSINIEINEADTKVGIENAMVNLLDSEKNIISTLTTNEQGKIFIEHLIPGKYYIQQIATEEGYITYKKLIELNMEYNKVVDLNINNSKENIQNIYNKEENITITEEIIEKNINNKIIDKTINNKDEITNQNNISNSYTEDTENNISNITNNNDETNANNSHKENTENNTSNVTNKNEETNIINKNNTTNETNTNNSYTENNQNSENNISNKNNLNIQNNSSNVNKNTTTVIKNPSSSAINNNLQNATINTVKTLPRTGM